MTELIEGFEKFEQKLKGNDGKALLAICAGKTDKGVSKINNTILQSIGDLLAWFYDLLNQFRIKY